jgi:putative cell wall-binding protein
MVAAAVLSRFRGVTPLGPLAGSTALDLRVVMQPRDPSALARFVAAVSTPGSPRYGRYLGPGQFAARFGPTAATVAAVRSWLRAAGLASGPLSADGLLLPVRTDAARAGRAFGTGLARVRLADGRIAFANTRAVTVTGPMGRAVQAVVGLDDVAISHPQVVSHAAGASSGTGATSGPATASGPTPCAAATSTAASFSAYTADQLATAYGFGPLYARASGSPGAGQTVAIYELEPYSASDIATFQACYGTSSSVTNVAVDGGTGTGTGSGEAALDIENVIGLSPGAAIKVYEAPNGPATAIDNYTRIVDDDSAQVISTSWGICEPESDPSAVSAESSLFQQAAAQGQTVLAASGDDGSEDCVNASGASTGALAVDDPGSQPFVTSVGGTDLTSIGPPPTETVWNDPGFGSSGGGISTFWAMPSWQSASNVTGLPSNLSSGAPCHNPNGFCREVPDVSASADPLHGYVVYFSGRWSVDGGASAGPPLWAALLSIINQGRGTPVGFVNPALYQKSGTGALQLNDVVTGNNDFTGTNAGTYPATAGFDMATGLGTPVGCSLAQALGVPGATCAGPGTVDPSTSTITASSTSAPADGTTPVTITVTLLDPFGTAVTGKSVTLAQGPGHSSISSAPGAVTDSNGQVQFQVTDSTAEAVTYTAVDTTDHVTLTTSATVGFARTVTVDAGGTASSDPAGTTPSTADPVVASVVSPNPGTVTFIPGAATGSVPGARVEGFGMSITAPGASVTQPLILTFQLAAGAFPPGTGPGDVGVLQDGAPVAPCTQAVGGAGAGSVPAGTPQAVPDPCRSSASGSGGVITITVASSHASTWSFSAPLSVRLAGADREATAGAVSQAGFPAGGAGAVVLARDDTYPDALAGAALAGARHAPVLLTSPAALDAGPEAELRRVLPAGGTVFLLGGTAALSDRVASQVVSDGYHVTRLSGPDRYATAAAVAGVVGSPSGALLTTGDDFPDALAAAAATAGGGRVVLLTHGSTMPTPTRSYLAAHPGLQVYAVGGPAAAADPAATAVAGADRYATAAAVARQFFSFPATVGLATGLAFPDALAAGPRLAALGVPLLLTGPGTLSSATSAYLGASAHTIERLEVYGGPAALSDSVVQQALALTG